MRTTLHVALCGLVAGWGGLAGAQPASDPAVQVSPPSEAGEADGGGARVLRGSSAEPRPLEVAGMDPARWQVSAGDELWLVDPANGEVVACRLRDTSTVGRRVIRCYSGDLPGGVAD